MKIPPASADKFVQSPAADLQGALIFGKNHGLAQEYAAALLLQAGTEPTQLYQDQVLESPARLFDAAFASSLFGGGAPVYVRGCSDKIYKLLADLLAVPDAKRNFVVCEAAELTPKSKLRTLFEGAAHLAALACYVDQGAVLAAKLKDMAREMGARLSAEAADFLAEKLPGDRMAQKSELQKLALYAGGTDITLKHAMAAIGDAGDVTAFDLPWQVFGGEQAQLDRSLERLFAEKTSGILLLRLLTNHALNLYGVQSGAERVEALPIFKNLQPRFNAQLRRWNLSALQRALALLNHTEALCKSTGFVEETLVRQTCFTLGQQAAGAGR